jgi:hypothetical protein
LLGIRLTAVEAPGVLAAVCKQVIESENSQEIESMDPLETNHLCPVSSETCRYFL